MTTSSDPVAIQLLADHAHLITVIGDLRWREWGHAPDPENPDWWTNVTAREAGRNHLPVTWVAIDAQGGAVGAVGLAAFDIEERRDRSPWVVGMIVHPDCRGRGIGRLLIAHLEAWVGLHEYQQVWVATGDYAINFYRKCGWALSETIERASGEAALVLTKHV